METIITKKVSIVLARQEKRHCMRERIQQKAEELFIRYGIRSVTMDEIAGQLGISKKTIYQSFEDKDELVLAVFDSHIAADKERCLVDAGKAQNAIHEVFLELELMEEMFSTMNPSILYDLEKYHPKVFRKFYEYKNEFLLGVVMDNLNRGIREELYRPDINVEIMSRFRIGCIMISFNLDVYPKNKFNVLEVEEQVIVHFLYGIATPKGIKLIQKYQQQRSALKKS